MRLTVLSFCVLLTVGCSENESALGPAQPTILRGDYSGTISFQQYAGTDSAWSGTDSIYFTYYPDTTYYFELSEIGDCGYGGGPYDFSGDQIVFDNNMIYKAICGLGPGAIYFVIGEYGVRRIRNGLVLKQEIPAFDLAFQIELRRTTRMPR